LRLRASGDQRSLGITLFRIAATQLSFCLVGVILLVGCQAFGGGDAVATIDGDLTMFASEGESIRAMGTAEQAMVVETIAAAGTRVARLSLVNAALGATLRAHHTVTPEVEVAVVSAEDVGRSLGDDMMDDEPENRAQESVMRVSNLSTAADKDPDSGCSSGTVQQFQPNSELLYVTARVTALQSGALFEVEWQYDGATVSHASWRADYSKSFECIWFYATPVDFPFLPGQYAATLYVNSERLGTTEFTIVGS
jgi:hypothetical protein